MNTIFFGQNVPIQSATKVKIDYINKTKLPIKVSIRWRDRDVLNYTTRPFPEVDSNSFNATVCSTIPAASRFKVSVV